MKYPTSLLHYMYLWQNPSLWHISPSTPKAQWSHTQTAVLGQCSKQAYSYLCKAGERRGVEIFLLQTTFLQTKACATAAHSPYETMWGRHSDLPSLLSLIFRWDLVPVHCWYILMFWVNVALFFDVAIDVMTPKWELFMDLYSIYL